MLIQFNIYNQDKCQRIERLSCIQLTYIHNIVKVSFIIYILVRSWKPFRLTLKPCNLLTCVLVTCVYPKIGNGRWTIYVHTYGG